MTLWRNTVTGGLVETDRKLSYPYVKEPVVRHKAILQPEPRVDIVVETEDEEE